MFFSQTRSQLQRYSSHTEDDDTKHGAWRSRVWSSNRRPGRYSGCPCPRFLPWITHFTWQSTDILNCFLCFLVAGVASGSLKTQYCSLRSNIKFIYQNLSNLVRCPGLSQLSGTRRPPKNDFSSQRAFPGFAGFQRDIVI